MWNNKKGFDAWGNLATAATPADLFKAWEPAKLIFDVTPKWGAPMIGMGTAIGVPNTDILGKTRTAPQTAGAFSYPF